MAGRFRKTSLYLAISLVVLSTSALITLFSACKMPTFDLETAKMLAGVNADTSDYRYIVVFDSQGADVDAVPSSIEVEPPETTVGTLPAEPTRAGFFFGGWWTETGGGGTEFSAATTVTGDITVYAYWSSVPTYTVSYYANGADSGTAPGNQTKFQGTDLTLATNSGTLTKTGHTFAGWNTQADGNGTHYAEGATYPHDSPQILYAEWTTTYTLTYDGNGAGGLGPVAGIYNSGDNATVAGKESLEYLQDGISFRFTGWNTAAGGGGTAYQESDIIVMTADVTLWAQWDVIGGVGPAGGLVFYDTGVTTDGWRYLEAAPLGNEFTTVWGDSTVQTSTSATAVGTGKHNTGMNVAVLQNYNGGMYASRQAEQVSSGGYTDWFLPSQDELQAMYASLHTNGWGDFTNNTYWSSSEGGMTAGATFSFSTGSPNSEGKDIDERVRPARAFSSTTPTHLVIYAPNGADSGDAPVDPYHYAPGDTVTGLSGPGTLALTGHYLTGWNTLADGSGVDYSVGATPPMPNANLVLYAQWSPLFAGGDGSPGTPYQINSPEGLDAIRLDLTADYELVADIDLGVPPWNSGAGWEPISTFSGTLEGNDKIIQNLFIDRTTGVGLFDNTQGATIRNLILDNVDITASSGWAGAIAGRTNSVGGGTTIVNVSAAGTVTGGQQLGGLVGLGQNLTLTNSFAEVDVVSSADSVGGLVGRFTGTGTIENSYALGSVNGVDSVGGLVGFLDGTVTNTFAAGTVSGSSNVGGLVGTNTGTVNDSYYDKDTTGQTTGAGMGYTTTQMMIQANYPAWDFAVIWDIFGGFTYPFLR